VVPVTIGVVTFMDEAHRRPDFKKNLMTLGRSRRCGWGLSSPTRIVRGANDCAAREIEVKSLKATATAPKERNSSYRSTFKRKTPIGRISAARDDYTEAWDLRQALLAISMSGAVLTFAVLH